MTQTAIRKNSSKISGIFANAHDIKSHSLDNGFKAHDMTGDCVNPNDWSSTVSPQNYLALTFTKYSRYAKLTKDSNGNYRLSIHSNLWYDFQSS